MNKYESIIIIVLILVTLGLVACGGESESQSRAARWTVACETEDNFSTSNATEVHAIGDSLVFKVDGKLHIISATACHSKEN